MSVTVRAPPEDPVAGGCVDEGMAGGREFELRDPILFLHATHLAPDVDAGVTIVEPHTEAHRGDARQRLSLIHI